MILERNEYNTCYRTSDYERRGPSSMSSISDARDPFEKDYGRIVHSAAFRRLQAKTQVIGLDVGDIHRTRLTHSMEVAQIARGIVIHLNENHAVFQEKQSLDASLVEAAALAHDLGHPPFGHHGEYALHECMKPYGGFEGNAQTFRILTRLEGDKKLGLNPTRGLLMSILKYPILLNKAMADATDPAQTQHPPKASAYQSDQEAFDWMLAPLTTEERAHLTHTKELPNGYLKTVHKPLECSIIELADDIAYATHDLEDAINLGFLRVDELVDLVQVFLKYNKEPALQQAIYNLKQLESDRDSLKYQLNRVFGAIISTFIHSLEVHQLFFADQTPSMRISHTVLMPSDLQAILERFSQVVMERVIHSQKVQMVAFKGQRMIHQLFEAMMNNHLLLSENDRILYQQVSSDSDRARVVCDYIAGMTDSFATKMHARLFGHSRSFFDH
ncbi:anti-phage deoxyguanosine triphosphatase [Thermoactinomyces sp. DSM 45892]|uniref:anti-phage deoxyguanosine triphosphatase n=1 Tax=Thermoactinomyces sp. DSM 45892 TaxID=1882753 RepID=UPI00089AEF3F|nr:anti-phage deoxyguanosine triphosphatase [Thermoactinomyces sp. DSM 45892]SDY02191.1 dGTPase [Thermoactinomyces sp. DSM 45892]